MFPRQRRKRLDVHLWEVSAETEYKVYCTKHYLSGHFLKMASKLTSLCGFSFSHCWRHSLGLGWSFFFFLPPAAVYFACVCICARVKEDRFISRSCSHKEQRKVEREFLNICSKGKTNSGSTCKWNNCGGRKEQSFSNAGHDLSWRSAGCSRTSTEGEN